MRHQRFVERVGSYVIARLEIKRPSREQTSRLASSTFSTAKPNELATNEQINLTITVAVPTRRLALFKRTTCKVPTRVYFARQFSGLVQAIWTTREHNIYSYFYSETFPVSRHA